MENISHSQKRKEKNKTGNLTISKKSMNGYLVLSKKLEHHLLRELTSFKNIRMKKPLKRRVKKKMRIRILLMHLDSAYSNILNSCNL